MTNNSLKNNYTAVLGSKSRLGPDLDQTWMLRYDISELWEMGRGAEMQAVEAAERNWSVSLHRVKTWPQLMCCALA